MLRSFVTDFILVNTQYNECLQELRIKDIWYIETMIFLTWLFRKASAKCCAPLSPIWFCWSHISLSVYVIWDRWIFQAKKIWYATVLFRRASERCCTPLSPIWFSSRPRPVSICVKWRIGIIGGEQDLCVSPYYFEEHQLDIVLLYCWFGFLGYPDKSVPIWAVKMRLKRPNETCYLVSL